MGSAHKQLQHSKEHFVMVEHLQQPDCQGLGLLLSGCSPIGPGIARLAHSPSHHSSAAAELRCSAGAASMGEAREPVA